MNVLRHATATLPDGTRLRRVRALLDGDTLRLADDRTGATVFEAPVDDTDVRQKRWRVTTPTGVVLVRSGCGCSGR